VQEGTSRAIQPYAISDSPPIISRSDYMNALIQWVKCYYIGANRLPIKKLRFAIKTCTPSKQNYGWGDTYFANSLARAFVNFGHKCEVHFRNVWDQLDSHIDIVIHITGLFRYTPKPNNFNILWIINHPELHTFEEINQFDVVFCASKLYLENLKNNIKIPCFYLPQTTDDEFFNPSKNNSTKDIDILFVGNNYYGGRKCRKIIQDVLETGKQYNLCVVGQGWHNIIDDRYIKAEFVEWEKLPELYARAKIVLNDHQQSMRQFGFVNNRTFDLAALKAFQISNYVEGIEEFGIVTYKTPEDLRQKLDYLLQNESERQEFANISNNLCQGHTFTNAARRIVDVANKLFNEKNSIKDIQKWSAENVTLDSVEMTDTKIVPRLVPKPMEILQQMQDK
jgi:spore maturation protein CgeB